MPSAPPLTPIATLTIQVAAPITIGHTSAGLRRIVAITGGEVHGPRLNGRILPAGADFQTIQPDGFSRLEARYAIETNDGAMIYIENQGVRFGPPEVMAKITRGETVDPALVYFRTIPRFETAAPLYQFLTRPLFLGVGARFPDRVELEIFEVG